MQIINAENNEQMAYLAAQNIIQTIQQKNDAIICLATGGSPKRMYEIMANEINAKQIDISQITFVKLDEWYGMEEDDENTCTTFIKKHLLSKLAMQPKQFIAFPSQPKNDDAELQKVQQFLTENPIDVMILGLGMNGHLALNEPHSYLQLDCHKATLHETTKSHDMAKGKVLTHGLTLGMKAIFDSKQVILLVSGTKKEEAYQKFMSQQISTQTPASFLWLHPNCFTYIDNQQFPQKK